MKILMLTTQNAAIAWWRFQAPAKALRAAGHEVTIFEEPEYSEAAVSYGGLWGWLLEHSHDYDVIHVGYSSSDVLTRILLAIRHKENKKFITDIDDDYTKVPTYNAGFKTFGPATLDRRIVRAQLLVSDAISVTTPTLSQALDVSSRPHHILPNMVYLPDWDHPVDPQRHKDSTIRIMLAGGNARYGDWALIQEALESVVAKYGQKVRLIFAGCTPDWVEQWLQDRGVPENNRATYVQPVMDPALFPKVMKWLAPDIYLSPTIPNQFNASKSNLKAIEAALSGATFMCTDFTTYGDVPNDACLKVSNTYTQWFEGLSALVEDATLRKRLNHKCLNWVYDTRDITKNTKMWLDTYQSVLDSPAITSLEDLKLPN